MPKNILDDISFVKKIDRSAMLDAVSAFPDMIQKGIELAQDVRLDQKSRSGLIMVSGMGGSAIGGDVLASILSGRCEAPIIVNRRGSLPCAAEETLFFAVSYSGNTEETLSALSFAERKKFNIVCLTSGGELERIAKKKGYPLALVPKGYQPRAALGFLFSPMLVILERMGLAAGALDELKSSARSLKSLMKKYALSTPANSNPAKKAASFLHKSVPLIWGISGFTDATALRWKAQVNENSKMTAFSNLFPELDHNEIVGLARAGQSKLPLAAVILQSGDEPRSMKARIEATKNVLPKKLFNVLDVFAEGGTRTEKILSLISLGDHMSVYLSCLNKIDPTPVEIIEELKKRIAAKSG